MNSHADNHDIPFNLAKRFRQKWFVIDTVAMHTRLNGLQQFFDKTVIQTYK